MEGKTESTHSTVIDRSVIVFDSSTEILEENKNGRKRMNKSARARERKRLKTLETAKVGKGDVDDMFDYVLVDAECSTDGAINHLKQRMGRDTTAVEGVDVSNERESELAELQYGLLRNGFENVVVGGVVVYSTCSLSEKQNEEVVARLLREFSEGVEGGKVATTVNIEELETSPSREGSIKHVRRFDPTLSAKGSEEFSGSGFFVAKITRVK